MGDARAEGSSAIGDGGQAAVSFRPDVNGTGSGSSREPEPGLSASGLSETAGCPSSPIADCPLAPPSPTSSLSSSQ